MPICDARGHTRSSRWFGAARARDLGISDGTAPADEAYLGFHLPAGNGRLAVVARLELQADGAGAHVGDGQVGRRAGQLWGWRQSDIFRPR